MSLQCRTNLIQQNKKIYSKVCKKKLTNETNPEVKQILKDSIERFLYYLQSLAYIQPRLPNQTFSQKVIFRGSEQEAELSFAGAARPSGDSYLVIPPENVAFIRDIGSVNKLPYMQDCIPDEWVKMLRNLLYPIWKSSSLVMELSEPDNTWSVGSTRHEIICQYLN